MIALCMLWVGLQVAGLALIREYVGGYVLALMLDIVFQYWLIRRGIKEAM